MNLCGLEALGRCLRVSSKKTMQTWEGCCGCESSRMPETVCKEAGHHLNVVACESQPPQFLCLRVWGRGRGANRCHLFLGPSYGSGSNKMGQVTRERPSAFFWETVTNSVPADFVSNLHATGFLCWVPAFIHTSRKEGWGRAHS